ncbi:hypothetical protein [Actinoplanes sp. NPDC026619]|uniref:hypothetical protein n=1 Tax=Actinoplanes sp. NPDC026619 TaxID=3155798 RepID=UPI0033C557B9
MAEETAPEESLRSRAAGWSSAAGRIAGAQVAAALAAAHEAGAKHLALTPDVILVVRGSDPPLVRVTGFGAVGAERNAWSAPEIGGETPVTAAADVYSLGAVLAELFPALAEELADCRAADPAARPSAAAIATRLSGPIPATTEAPAPPTPSAEEETAEEPPAKVESGPELAEAPKPVEAPKPWKRRGIVEPVLAVAVVAALLALAGLAAHLHGTDDDQARPAPSVTAVPSASPAPSTTPVAQTLRATMAAHLPDGAGTLYLAMRDGKALAYFCDGKKVEAWYRGTAADGRIALTGRNGNTMTGEFTGLASSGSVSVKGRTTSFKIPAVRKPSGLYRSSAKVRNAKVDGTWIVLPDGSQVGVLDTDGVPGPAPRLDVGTGTTSIGGSSVPAVEVDVETGAGLT